MPPALPSTKLSSVFGRRATSGSSPLARYFFAQRACLPTWYSPLVSFVRVFWYLNITEYIDFSRILRGSRNWPTEMGNNYTRTIHGSGTWPATCRLARLDFSTFREPRDSPKAFVHTVSNRRGLLCSLIDVLLRKLSDNRAKWDRTAFAGKSRLTP